MGRRPQFDEPWTLGLLAILDCGDWFEYDVVIEKVSQAVPDQLGWEKGEYYRRSRYERQHQPVPPRKDGRDEETIRTGQRVVLSRTIRMLGYHKIVQIEYELRGKKRLTPVRIRLTPPQPLD